MFAGGVLVCLSGSLACDMDLEDLLVDLGDLLDELLYPAVLSCPCFYLLSSVYRDIDRLGFSSDFFGDDVTGVFVALCASAVWISACHLDGCERALDHRSELGQILDLGVTSSFQDVD